MATAYGTIISLISGCSESELRSLNHLVCDNLRAQSSSRARQLTNTFNYGDKVFFIHKGIRHDGTVVKINATTVKVDVNGLVWKCSPGLLRRPAPAPAPSVPVQSENVQEKS
jgi:hypothetical protein